MVRLVPGSRVARTVVFLRALGRPATIAEIVEGIGEPPDGWRVFGVQCSINARVAKGEVFTRCDGRIGLLESTPVYIGKKIPLSDRPSEDPTPMELRRFMGRARVRVVRRLAEHLEVNTPNGPVRERPKSCQWCDATPTQIRSRHTHEKATIEGHHFLPYGPAENDLFVLFVCARCHHRFSTGIFTTQMIFDRFRINPAKSNVTAVTRDYTEVAPVTGDYTRRNQ